MKPLIVLASVFGLTLLLTYTFNAREDLYLAGRLALAVMLLFTSLAHFVFMKGMVLMVPPFIPMAIKKTMVTVTGVIEIIAAAGIMIYETRVIAGYALVIFLAALLPANVYATQRRVNMEAGDFTGPGIYYLWFRIPMQLFLIAWTAYFAIIHPYPH
ncbi:DoxX family protein [Mucilaginibacter ginkgonis]|uniref:DoxX-like protein n=1 Tax=Mucilaginibacter ginkgonis TaxID=2682091 RepID=A0A6I4I0R1_9SPHI|nr:hypothetical protein [Mucilaginibacter ginkgonis]QQL48694.1 hypothetical protein GO620_010940 [Mucilaginibacter ginkgonis]